MRTDLSLLISGELGLQCLKELYCYCNIKFIATDKASNGIIEYARIHNIAIFIGNPRNGKLADFIGEERITLLFSINYLFIIEDDVISKVATPINFHGSLLPKYRGRTPHVWSIINNEKTTGITAHIIDNGCDTGDIILQKKVSIDESDTGMSILQKYFLLYPKLIREVINLYEADKFEYRKQEEYLATYFGKRTPDDGLINWNWQKERINNWVRALSAPYPGAFTYLNKTKIIIDKVSFSDLGFTDLMVNGTVLQVEPHIVVKTPNGAVRLEEIRNKEIKFEKGLILES